MTEKMGNFDGYEIFVGNTPNIDAFPNLLDGLPRGVLTQVATPDSYQKEEEQIARQGANVSDVFERNRRKVINALRAIVGFTFKHFQLPTNDGIDFGSGATGAMVESLLPKASDKSTWKQVEINPSAVVANKRRHPQSNIIRGSYHNVGDLDLPSTNIATGLSSLDATQFIDHAVAEIRSGLKAGGYFLHVQDVRPGVGTGPRELTHMGYSEPYDIVAVPGTSDEPLGFKVPNEGWVSVGELFRRQIGRALENSPNFDVIANNWVSANKSLMIPVNRGLIESMTTTATGRIYFLNMLLGINAPIEEASVVVTLAKAV